LEAQAEACEYEDGAVWRALESSGDGALAVLALWIVIL
jgi:hypothetical protein